MTKLDSILKNKPSFEAFLIEKGLKRNKEYVDNEFPDSTFFGLGDNKLLAVQEYEKEEDIKKFKDHFLIDKGLTHCALFSSERILFYRNYGEIRNFVYSLRTKDHISKTDKLTKINENFDFIFQVKDISKAFYEHFKSKRDLVVQGIENKIESTEKYLITQKIFDRIFFIYFLCHKQIVRFNDGDELDGKNLFKILSENGEFVQNLYSMFSCFNNDTERVLKIASYQIHFPFLNGGLFRLGLNEDKIKINLSNKQWGHVFEFLNSYHWIIEDSDEEIDQEKILTPEILGHVYERSVVEWEQKGFEQEVAESLGQSKRHELGVYYTPEEITGYMCKTSIESFLLSKFDNYDSLENLFQNKNQNDLKKSLELLNSIKVLDPACGSGAFLIKSAEHIFKLKSKIKNILKQNHEYYDTKLEIITKNIFGVDILQGAIEIAKLRLWLWIISSYSDDKEIAPLPNIEYNLVVGDSLLGWVDEKLPMTLSNPMTEEIKGIFLGAKVFSSDTEKELLNDSIKLLDSYDLTNYTLAYSKLSNNLYKNAHTKQASLIKEILEKVRSSIYYSVSDSYLKFINPKKKTKTTKNFSTWSDLKTIPFHWSFDFSHILTDGGFDIVIANPPYVDSEQMTKKQKKYREMLVKTFDSTKGNWDLYIPFFERSMQLCKSDGILCLISPNKWLSIGYGHELRSILSNNLIKLTNCDDVDVFGTEAENSPVISSFKKQLALQEIKIDRFVSDYTINENPPIPRKILELDNWGMLISPYVDTLLQLLKEENRLSDYGVEIENPFIVSEAYELLELIKDNKKDEKNFKLINTGTIDSFQTLWGKKTTTYIKHKFIHPFVDAKKLNETMPKRFEQSKSPKLIIAGMRYFELFLDSEGKYVAGKSTMIIRKSPKISLKALNSLLNSRVVRFFIQEAYRSTGIDGGVNFSRKMIEKIPVPNLSEKTIMLLEQFTDRIINNEQDETKFNSIQEELNEFIYTLYNLNKSKISIISNTCK